MSDVASSFIWYELVTGDLDAAASFYGAVIGWSVQRAGAPGMDYRLWSIGGEVVGGLFAIPPGADAMRPAWLGYIRVADVDDSIGSIKEAGGNVLMPATDVPDVGRIALLTDPQGAAFYVMTPIGEDASPSYAPGRPGHGGWHELHTSDWQAALAFYGTQFGWVKSDAMDMGPMGTYLLFNSGPLHNPAAAPIGGMMNNGGFGRPLWLFYFNVDDIETAKTRVRAAGGTVHNGPVQVPGGSWVLQAQDPQGAMFALVGPDKS